MYFYHHFSFKSIEKLQSIAHGGTRIHAVSNSTSNMKGFIFIVRLVREGKCWILVENRKITNNDWRHSNKSHEKKNNKKPKLTKIKGEKASQKKNRDIWFCIYVYARETIFNDRYMERWKWLLCECVNCKIEKQK